MTTHHDFKGIDDWFPAFMGGEQIDSNGSKRTWTNQELDEIVANTKKRIEQNVFSGAPFVVGHPKDNAPAYGWTGDIKRDGNVILVKGAKVHDEFASGVEKGLWPNRSIRIGKDKGGFYLRHVGFLGALAPAIEGMDAIYSVNTDDECFDYSIDSMTPTTVSRLMRRMRDFLIEKYGVEYADKVIPDYEIESLSEHANSLREEDSNTPSYSNTDPKPGDKPMPDFTQADIDAAVEKATKAAQEKAATDFAEKQEVNDKELTVERNKRLVIEFSGDISALLDTGQLLPAQTEGMAEFMLQLSDTNEAQFEFSAGEKDKVETIKKSPLKWFQQFTKSIGKQIDLSESDAGKSSAVDGDDAKAIANAAVQYRKAQADAGISISTTQAVAHVTKQNK